MLQLFVIGEIVLQLFMLQTDEFVGSAGEQVVIEPVGERIHLTVERRTHESNAGHGLGRFLLEGGGGLGGGFRLQHHGGRIAPGEGPYVGAGSSGERDGGCEQNSDDRPVAGHCTSIKF